MVKKLIQSHKCAGIKLFVILTFLACKNSVTSKVNYKQTVYGVWHKLTKNTKGDFILYKPCDALNTSISVKQDINSIIVNYGIESQTYNYTSIVQEGREVEFQGVKSFGKSLVNISLKFEKGIGVWHLPNNFTVVTTKELNNYKVVEENCNDDKITLQDQINEYQKLGYSLIKKYLYDINGDNKKDAFLLLKGEKMDNNLLSILINGDDGFNIWRQSVKVLSSVNSDSCPTEGFNDLIFENNYFTIEESICDGWMFVDNYITFEYDESTDEIYLYSQKFSYTDRRNPNKELPKKMYTKQEFGKITFKQFDNKNISWMK
ncbi:hypothetical protein V2633_00020 [Tenacibaculum maritimum]|uniref:hypothetical protein n=1 Tax=Tenacibaculum maritimum TaxID=107401 RepID=UPI003876D4F0